MKKGGSTMARSAVPNLYHDRLPLSSLGRQAIFQAFYEYILIVAPVVIFIGLEILHKADLAWFISSPEWAIATIFLAVQGQALHRRAMADAGARLSQSHFNWTGLAVVTISIISALNAFMSLHHNTITTICLRIILLLFVSTGFMLFVAGANLKHLQSKEGRDGR